MKDKFLTLSEAAERTGLTRSRLYELAESGAIPSVHGASGMLFRAEELAALQPKVGR